MKIILLTFLAFLLLAFRVDSTIPEKKVVKILHQVFDSIKNINSVEYKISSIERTSKGFVTAGSEVKLQTHPLKFYFHNTEKKIEILYNPSISETKTLVRNDNILNISILLDPNNALMRKNQHHTIMDLGFDFIGKAIAFTISKDLEGINHLTLHGKCVKNGYSCYLLEYENLSFDYEDYKVGANENISFIAKKLIVNDHIIRYKNNMLNNFGYLKKGEIIKVPNLFCKKAVIYVDDKMMLPVSAALFDDVGLFETYDFNNISLNKQFSELDFDRHNKAYHF